VALIKLPKISNSHKILTYYEEKKPMAQQFNRPCPNCNMPVASGQRFCSNCGSIVEPGAYQPTERTPNSGSSSADMGTYLETPPPPPMDSYGQTSMPPSSSNYQNPQAGYQQPPSYAQPTKDSSKKVVGQIGCGVLAIILLAVALCGTAGFFVYRAVSSNVSESIKSSSSYTTTNTGSSSSDVTPTLAPPTTSPINAALKFADVDMTIVDIKQAGGFTDETGSSNTPVILRIDLKENNTTAHSSDYLYGDIARLIMSDGTSITPFNSQYLEGPDASVTRTNWIDFGVKSNLDVSKLTLQLGTAAQAQISVPLTNNPDITKYEPKTITPGKSTTYVGTTWTLVTATAQLSGNNQQAPTGQMYVVVTLRIDNNSSQSFDAYWGNYMRLQTGTTKATPADGTNVPLSASPGQTNQTGTVLFLVPQGSTNFTFLLLPNASTGATQQASIPFQIS
jgi:hypothetical protein